MNFITKYLNKPFPILVKTNQQLLSSILFGIFVFLFLSVFKPFEINTIEGFTNLYLIGFGAITTIVMLLSFFVAPVAFKSFFNPDQWNMGKNLIFILGILGLISILNWAYNTYFCDGISVQHNLLQFVLITVSIGVFPVIFLMFFIELYLNKSNQTIAKSVDAQIHNLPHETESIKVIIKGENKNEDLPLLLNQLICVKSEGNYAQVYFKNQDAIQKKIIRNSISSIENQLGNFDTIYRCHRSYLVNLENVNEVTGNARNFNLLVNDLGFNIPVSRSFPKSILSSIA